MIYDLFELNRYCTQRVTLQYHQCKSASQEEVSAAAKALGKVPSGSKSTLIHQIVEHLQPSSQQLDQVQQRLERLTKVSPHLNCHYVSLKSC